MQHNILTGRTNCFINASNKHHCPMNVSITMPETNTHPAAAKPRSLPVESTSQIIMKKFLNLAVALLFASLLFSSPVQAAVIPGVTIQSVSSEYVSGRDQRRATNIVNGVGLFGNKLHSLSAPGCMWLTSPTTAGAYTNAFVVFDLGAVRPVKEMRVWNYNERGQTGRGVQRANLWVAGDDLNFTLFSNAVTLVQGPGGDSLYDFSQVIDFGGVTVRYVRLNVLTNYSGTDNRVGLSEVQFIDTNVPPALVEATYGYLSNRVVVKFSEGMAAASAASAANYSITNGTNSVAILSAVLDGIQENVILTTAPLSNLVYTLTVSNVAAASDGSILANAQVTIEPQLAVWLKAGAGVTTDGSGYVSQWADQSGNGNNALQPLPGPAFTPQLIANDINGQPTLRFVNDSSFTNYLQIPYSSSMRLGYDFTIFAVLKVDNGTANNHIMSRAVGNAAAPIDFYARSADVVLYRGNQAQAGGAYGSSGSTQPLASGEPALVTVRTYNTNVFHYKNGALVNTGPTYVGVEDSKSVTRLAARDDFGNRLNGNLAEFLLFRGTVSDAERVAINDYLGAKYGIAVVNILFVEQPANASKLEGQTAEFKVKVQASALDVTYQWQKGTTDIPGATNSTYTTPILTQSDNGSTYRVRVAIPGYSEFSDAATLTVSADTEKPTIVYAGKVLWNSSDVTVVFSESVQPSTGTNAGNYTLDHGVTVMAVALGDTANKVVLTTSGLTSGTSYLVTIQNVQDLFGNTMDATQVAVGLYPRTALWLKAEAGVTADGSGFVSAWDDQSGNGNSVIAPGSSPTLVASGFNGQPIIHFDGTNNYLAAPPSPSLAITGDMAIYAVTRFEDYDGTREIIGKTTVNIPAPFDYYAGPTTGRLRFYRGNGGNGGSGVSYQNVTSTDAASLNVPHILCANMAGTTASHYLDGALNGTGDITVPIADNNDPIGIGTRSDLVPKMKGDIAEIIVFDLALSAGDRASLDSYLSMKYGIPLVGPELPVISITSTSGNVTLSWPASAAGFNLESSSALPVVSWNPVTNAVVTAGGTNSVSISSTNTQQFFRLRK